MKKIKMRFIAILTASLAWLALMPISSPASESPVLMYISAVLLPAPENPAALDQQGAALVQKLYDGEPVGDLGYRLQPDYLSQDVAVAKSTLWFSIHIVAKDPSFRFSPLNRIRFVGKSNDTSDKYPQGSLEKTNVFTNPATKFTSSAEGIVWGSGGPRFNDQIMVGFWKDKLVNEFIFDGAMSVYYKYTDQDSLAGIARYIGQFTDFQVTGTWQFLSEDGGSVLASVSRTLYFRGKPIDSRLSIKCITNGVQVGISAGENDSWILQSSTSISPVWTYVETASGGGVFTYPTANKATFWRLKLQ